MNSKLEEKKSEGGKKVSKKRGKTSNKTKLENDFHYLVPLLRFKDLGKENSKRQGYIKLEKDRQNFSIHVNKHHNLWNYIFVTEKINLKEVN